MPDPPPPPTPTPTPPTQYDQLLIGGMGQMQWTWQLDLFIEGLDDLLDFVFPVTPPWVQPAYDRIMGFIDKIHSWFAPKLANGHTYQDAEEFLADWESATLYAESETEETRGDIAAMVIAGAGEPE